MSAHRALCASSDVLYAGKLTLGCLLWCLCVSAVPIYAKRIFDGSFGVRKFPFPCFAAFLQLGAASLLLATVHLLQLACAMRYEGAVKSWLCGPHLRFKLRYAAPPGIAFGLKYAITNVALSLVDNSTHVLLGATELLWVLLLAVVLNKERPGVLEVLALTISLLGNFIVAATSAKTLDAPFWPLFLNLLAPFVGALCISTLRAGVAGLFDPANRLGGATSKVEFTVYKLGLASMAALLSAMVLENGLWAFQGTATSWWTALASYSAKGTWLILASGIITAVLHVTLAWLAWLTSAMAVGLLGEVKVLPQWSLNQVFGVKHALTSTYLLAAGLGIAGALLYATASVITQSYGKLVLTRMGCFWQHVEEVELSRPHAVVAESCSTSEGSSADTAEAQSSLDNCTSSRA